VTLCGWEGNRRSGVALAMCHRLSGLSTYGLKGHCAGDEHPAYAKIKHGPLLECTKTRLNRIKWGVKCLQLFLQLRFCQRLYWGYIPYRPKTNMLLLCPKLLSMYEIGTTPNFKFELCSTGVARGPANERKKYQGYPCKFDSKYAL